MRICRVMADTESFYGVIDGNRVYRLKGIPFDRIDIRDWNMTLIQLSCLPPVSRQKL